ncbi:MAG: ammonia-forming cytochrome c nitrite reductase subunit c552 [Acidobacteriota bacterium]|nr:ammonia-forming cytochrome c nitrite reductase subunit c552 [Acidobacteriota bacterium]
MRSVPRVVLIAVLAAAVGAAAVTALLINIFERKQEGRDPFFRVVEITDEIDDPAVWGKNFPMQYDSYRRTVDQVRTRYGGSEAVPRTPTSADPRSIVAQSRLEEDPRLRTIWAGYAFATDFREERGHAYMLQDQTLTERQQVAKQPGTCMHCHASVYLPYKRLGNGDLMAGFERMNQMPYAEARTKVTHPVSCIDCHDPSSMALRVTRPGFIEGIKLVKAAAGQADYDVNRDASRQDMRAFVCGQCHVEYYFKGPEKRLTYPWEKGLKADQILDYYEGNGFKDWTHAETGAPALKAQHPEFEMWNQGIHAKSGVTCVDCHMPYTRTGGLKVTDHHVRSPLLNINRACQTCHRWSEDELRDRVQTIQDRTYEMRNAAMDALVSLISDIKQARASKRPSAAIAAAQSFQRKAQFMLDFIEAENSMGFHAPQEAMRVLAKSIDFTRQGQVAIRLN